jgi:hypothetical protein
VTSFEELTDNPEWREEIRALYGNDIEKVDLMVGLTPSRSRRASVSARRRSGSSY